LRLVAWNAGEALAKKATRLLDLAPDIAIVAECGEAARLVGLDRVGWIGSNPHKGLAVYARPELAGVVSACWDDRHEWFLPISFSNLGLNVLAVWAMNHRGGEGPRLGRTHRALTRYASFLATGDAIVLGDFNDNVRWDTARNPAFATTTRLLEDAGYRNVYYSRTGVTPGAEPTGSFFFYRHRNRPYLIDHALVPDRWLSAIRTFAVGEPEDWLDLSDHVPVVLDLDLAAIDGARTIHGAR
jgi:hypothetical protein